MSVRRIQTPEAFADLYQPCRYKVYWGGRGAAKSTAFADALLTLADSKPLRILCAREIQRSIRESVHQLLADRAKENGFPYQVKLAEIVHPNGSRFFFEGLWNNIDSIKSMEGVDIVWIEEANTVSEDSWRKLIPTIRKPGSEIWASFNPELKSDPAYRRFVETQPPNAIVRKVSWRDNPWFTDEMRAEMDHLKATNPDEYLHVWEGELKQFADGSIYARQLKAARDDGRIGKVPIESGVPVNTFWDLGKNDSTAIWFHQRVGLQNRFIDYEECRLVDLDYYVKALKDRGYIYGTHYLPHDVDQDILGMTMTRRQQLESQGVKPLVVVERINSINEGIEMTRRQFSACWFDAARCERGLDALAAYQYVFDEKYDTFRPTPLHNWASNGADAFRQFGQGYAPGRGWSALMPERPMSERRAARIKPGAFSPATNWMT